MIRGIKRQMIMVKTDKSSIFEAAYFLLRTDVSEPRASGNEMLSEANRIISENASQRNRRKDERRTRLRNGLPFFVCGSITGVFITGMLWLFSFLG